jgi:hypothetical protein
MAKQLDVDKARRVILPTNWGGVVDLNSNFTTIIAEVNPETAGSDTTPVECDSIGTVAGTFKPKMDFQVTRLSNLGGDEMDEATVSVRMEYGKDPSKVMEDFKPENIVVKAVTKEDERVLLDQQLSYLALDDLQERLRDQKVAQLVQSNRESLIATLEEEIGRMQKIIDEAKASEI